MNYVAGFMFDHGRTRVALIRKEKPAWQKGLLNGIGGKIEADKDGFSSASAMAREFTEETGCQTTAQQWELFCAMSDGATWAVDFFATVGDLDLLRSMESEQVEILFLDDIWSRRAELVENLTWLIPLALDFLHDGRPSMAHASYPKEAE